MRAKVLNHPNADIQVAAQAILAEVPEPPPLPTPEFSRRLSASLRSTESEERKRAVREAVHLQSATPEIRQALAEVMRHDGTRRKPANQPLDRTAASQGVGVFH